jgi:hypothetical protein
VKKGGAKVPLFDFTYFVINLVGNFFFLIFVLSNQLNQINMSRFKFTTTKNGKCDVTITLFSKDNVWLLQRSSTFDVKPTIKEL